jgi:mRNA interferase MazF
VRRGEFYRVSRPGDPTQFQIFVIVSRQVLLDSRFSTVICAPVFSEGEGLATQVKVGLSEGLKNESWILCDSLVSIRKSDLAQYVGTLASPRLAELDRAIIVALDLR